MLVLCASINNSQFSHYFTVLVDNIGSNKYEVATTISPYNDYMPVYRDVCAILYIGMKFQ